MEDEMKRKFRKDKEKEQEPQAEAPQEQPEGEAPQEPTAEEQPAQEAQETDGITDLKPLLEASRQKAEEYLNLAQRVQADFDNFRRRNQSVRADAFEDGARELVKTLLPVVDNLERALAAESTDDNLKAGVAMVHKQLMDVLQKRGVEVIDRQGEVFDPNLETAVLQGTEDDGEKGTVCQVLQKGYRMGGVILRSAMVKVVPE
jgi:molecular chaperone GrpE